MSIRAVTAADRELLGNLLELYVHDLSPMFPQVVLGPNGRFGYPHLSKYFEGSGERWAWLIERADRTAGFVLAQRGSPASDDPSVLDVAEFFVLRGFRGQGVGEAAAHAAWKSLPGAWVVRVAEANRAGLAFWQRTVTSYLGRTAEPSQRSIGGKPWYVFQLDSRGGV